MNELACTAMFLCLVGCGIPPFDDIIKKDGSPYERHTTDPVFHEYLDQLPLRSNVPIIFEKRDKGIAGTCTKWTDGYREIQIDKDYWEQIDEAHRLELLAHEIGHCDYDLEHNNEMSEDNCPMSIMYDTNFGNPCFDRYFDYYMEEIHGG